MAEDGLTADAIKGMGWRQGSILPSGLVAALRAKKLLPAASEDVEVWAVLSHSCDVVNISLAREPSVEVIRIAGLNSRIDGSLAWFRNPRTCHFLDSIDGAEAGWQISIHDRFAVPRQTLLGHSPDEGKVLSAESIRRLASWAARRYVRPALPDEFNNRCSSVRKTLGRTLKSRGHLLSEVFLGGADEELPASVPYELLIWGCMEVEHYGDSETRQGAQELLNQIDTAFAKCDKINVRESSLRSEGEITLDDLKVLKRWDLDYFSLGDQDTDGSGLA